MIPKPQQKKLSSCCLLVIPKESRLRELPPRNGIVKSGTFIRQGLSQPQSAKEFSPARKHCLEKNPAENAKKLVEGSGLVKSCPPPIQKEREPQNARGWGLLHEESARKAYQRVASHTHHKHPKCFLISSSKPFLGASVDNIQKCQCSDGCPVRVVEYKCPWKHRDLNPEQAFLTPEIGGIQSGYKVALKSSSNYYFQVQLQMFVSSLILCIFVVWTNKGIFTVEVPCDPSFMSVVCAKLEKFLTSQVLPSL